MHTQRAIHFTLPSLLCHFGWLPFFRSLLSDVRVYLCVYLHGVQISNVCIHYNIILFHFILFYLFFFGLSHYICALSMMRTAFAYAQTHQMY